MTFNNIAVALMFVIAPIQASWAADVDPLWTKVIASHQETKKWIAKDVEQVIHATKDGDPTKTITIKKQFTGWEKGKAQYTVLSITPPPKDPSKKEVAFDLEEMFAPAEAGFFSPTAKFKRSDIQSLNGKPSVIFEITQSAGTLKIWADPTTGLIQKRVLEMGMPLAFEGNITTLYQIDPKGTNLPTESESKIDIKIPFKKAKLEMKDSYMNWVLQAK